MLALRKTGKLPSVNQPIQSRRSSDRKLIDRSIERLKKASRAVESASELVGSVKASVTDTYTVEMACAGCPKSGY